jgi:hypothetical protein
VSKFNIGDRVTIASPAYLIQTNDPKGYVDSDFYGKTGVVTRVEEEDDTSTRVGTAYEVKADSKGYSQTISQRYLTLAPVVKETLVDGVYRDDSSRDTVLVKDNKVIEVLIAGDGCTTPSGLNDHLSWLQGENLATRLTRLVAPTTYAPDVPADGIYIDSAGDTVLVKDGKGRDVATGTYVYDSNNYSDSYRNLEYHPYMPLVLETEVDAK